VPKKEEVRPEKTNGNLISARRDLEKLAGAFCHQIRELRGQIVEHMEDSTP
jgi:hypothetical protein